MTTSSHSRDAGAGDLSPVLSARWALTWKHLAVCLLFGGLFLYLNYQPLLDSKIWLHVYQGQWILEHGALPETDATQPLSEGMEVVVTCWLSQVAFSLADTWGGPQYVSNLFALAELVYVLILARVFYLQTRRVSLMMLGAGLVLLLGRDLQTFASPDVFGKCCFAALLWLVTRLRASGFGPLLKGRGHAGAAARGAWPYWLATAGLFIVWANLHGSFLLGIAVLVCCAAGRAIGLGWKTRSVVTVVSDGPTQRWVLLAQGAAVASLVNPYGLDLLRENVGLLWNEHLRAMPHWLPLNLPTLSGVLFLGSFAVLAAVLRHSRRRVQPAEVLLLLAFGAAVVPTGRTMAWYAPVFAWVLMPHVSEILARVWPAKTHAAQSRGTAALAPRDFGVSLICATAIWGSFALSPISQGLLGGKPRKAELILGAQTPRRVAEHLRKQPPPGLIFAPLPWADWLVRDGSPQLKLYMTSNVQWVPWRVRSDYVRLARAESRWERAFDRYGVDTVVVQKQSQESLRHAVQRSEEWNVVFEDETALIARRQHRLETSQTDE